MKLDQITPENLDSYSSQFELAFNVLKSSLNEDIKNIIELLNEITTELDLNEKDISNMSFKELINKMEESKRLILIGLSKYIKDHISSTIEEENEKTYGGISENILKMPIDKLWFNTRAEKCFKFRWEGDEKIKYIWELLLLTDKDILEQGHNTGQWTVNKIKEVLKKELNLEIWITGRDAYEISDFMEKVKKENKQLLD